MEAPKSKESLDDEKFVQRIRERFAEALDALQRQHPTRLSGEVGETIICGERIKRNFSANETLEIVGREFSLNEDEVERLRGLFFE
jgi:hypothetical protein